MTERFVVTTPSGEPVVRTDSPETADYYARVLEGHVIDREATHASVS